MTTLKTPPSPMPPDMTEKLYDIALDPEELSSFIETWNRNGFETEDLQSAVSEIRNFDEAFQSHILRADRFLQRQTVDDIHSLLSEALDPFDTSIALILDEKLSIAALNTPARTALGLQEGQGIDDFPLDLEDRGDLKAAVLQVFGKQSGDPVLLGFESPRTERQVIYHIKRLTHKAGGAPITMMPYALIATTDFYWPPVLSSTLESVFGLSDAERGIVQALTEGGDVKQVAQTRGTSVETVRSQLRSILGKCKVRSQAELIRMVLSLREVVGKRDASGVAAPAPNSVPRTDWLEQEVTKPLSTLTTRDGRRMDYLDQGPRDGAPILLSHMGYGHMRFSKPMLKLAYRHGLRVIAPVRAGYGDSDNLHRKDDVLAKTRSDTLELLDLLGIARLPYAVQGNDLLFAVDLVAAHPGRITEIAGICARPNLPGDVHYARMGSFQKYFLSSAKYAPNLLYFSAKAAFAWARKIGHEQMMRNTNANSPADLATLDDPDARLALLANLRMTLSETTDAAQAYTMEVLATETDWTDLMAAARDVPTWFINGAQDPTNDLDTIAAYGKAYPWIEIETHADAGQFLLYQKFDILIPRLAAAAHRARSEDG